MFRSTMVGASLFVIALAPRLAAQFPPGEPVRVIAVAEKIGVKVLPNAPMELEPGRSTTTMLAEPKKLEPYGIKGMHEGARVTITCVGPSRVRVEAEEVDPVMQRVVVTLRVNPDGTMVPAEERPAPASKPPGV